MLILQFYVDAWESVFIWHDSYFRPYTEFCPSSIFVKLRIQTSMFRKKRRLTAQNNIHLDIIQISIFYVLSYSISFSHFFNSNTKT